MSAIDKTVTSADEAVTDIGDGGLPRVGGFGLSGVPIVLIDALSRGSATGLHVASNNCGTDGWGLGTLLEQHRIARVVELLVLAEPANRGWPPPARRRRNHDASRICGMGRCR